MLHTHCLVELMQWLGLNFTEPLLSKLWYVLHNPSFTEYSNNLMDMSPSSPQYVSLTVYSKKKDVAWCQGRRIIYVVINVTMDSTSQINL